MRKSFILFFSLFLLVVLTACGDGEAEQLRLENAALQERVSALEAENAALQSETKQPRDETAQSDPEENPIDSFFYMADTDDTIAAMSTAAMSIVAWCHANAWEAEARNLAEELKSQLPLQEDRDLVDAYLAAVEEQLRLMDEMVVYPVSDLSVPQAERISTVGTLAHVLWPASYAQIWKDTFFQLLGVLPEIPGGQLQRYTFVFDPEAARQELAGYILG